MAATTTSIHRHVKAPRTDVYRTLLDPQAVAKWKVPTGMTCQIHTFDAREGGSFRVSLTYDEPTGTGKTTAHTDTYHGRFVHLVPDKKVVEVMEFETADPAMRGEMRVTFTLTDADGGTDVLAVHDNVPPGVAPADNEAGWREALGKLAALFERRPLNGRKRIDPTAFTHRFRQAVDASVAFAATMVRQPLPASWRFLIEPNASYDGNPFVDAEQVFPEESLPAGHRLGPWTFEEAVAWLWRDGNVPEWVDVLVHETSPEHTYVCLLCCGRFTGDEERLYYRNGLPPFGIKSPVLPIGWESVEASGRFDLPAVE